MVPLVSHRAVSPYLKWASVYILGGDTTVHEGTSVLHWPAAPVLLGLAGKHKAVKGNVTCSLGAEGVLLSSLGSGQPDNPENYSCFI